MNLIALYETLQLFHIIPARLKEQGAVSLAGVSSCAVVPAGPP